MKQRPGLSIIPKFHCICDVLLSDVGYVQLGYQHVLLEDVTEKSLLVLVRHDVNRAAHSGRFQPEIYLE